MSFIAELGKWAEILDPNPKMKSRTRIDLRPYKQIHKIPKVKKVLF